MSKTRERAIRDRVEDEERNEAVEDRSERDPWPRAAWSRALASNA
jgi:hypothetical protein